MSRILSSDMPKVNPPLRISCFRRLHLPRAFDCGFTGQPRRRRQGEGFELGSVGTQSEGEA